MAGVLFVFLCHVLTGTVSAQNPEGLPFLTNYSSQTYLSSPQNWCITEDHRGIMYFGNGDGVLEFDGATWRSIHITDHTTARSVAADTAGRVFVGGQGDLGYLAPDAGGRLVFVSLKHFIDSSAHQFADVWQVLATSAGVFFRTYKYLFRWNGTSMQVISSTSVFHNAFWVHGKLYVQQSRNGLFVLAGDALIPAPESRPFAGDRIFAMMSYDSARSLVITRNLGAWLYDGMSATKWATSDDTLLVQAQVYHGCDLPGGEFALATKRNGVLILDASGRIKGRIDKSAGLLDDNAWYVFRDRLGTLWVGLNDGISRIETSTPLRVFDERTGLQGHVVGSIRHQGRLYVITSIGLFHDHHGAFVQVSGIRNQCWSLLPFEEHLLVACNDGVFSVSNGRVRRITTQKTFALCRSRRRPNVVWAGLKEGMEALLFDGYGWRSIGKVNGVHEECRGMIEMENAVWVSTHYQGLMRLAFASDDILSPLTTRFTEHDGLPGRTSNAVDTLFGRLVVFKPEGLYVYDGATHRFSLDTVFRERLGFPETFIRHVAADTGGRFWIAGESIFGATEPTTLGHVFHRYPLRGLFERSVGQICVEGDDIWISSESGLLRLRRGAAHAPMYPYRPLIRLVRIGRDSVIWHGYGTRARLAPVAYAFRTLHLEFAAPRTDGEVKHLFQYYLEGLENAWSEWTDVTWKDYANLAEGTYVFHVRMHNPSGLDSLASAMTLRILAPWYHSWWAWLFYASALGAVWYGLHRWRVVVLRRRNVELEKTVNERTREVAEKNQQILRQQAEIIRSEKLAALGQMVAGMAHEINNPNAFVYGNLDYAIHHLEKWFRGESSTNEEREELLQALRHSSTGSLRIKAIVENLKNFSKLNESDLKDIQLNHDIEIIVALFFDHMGDIVFEKDLDPQLEERRISCYARELNHGIRNILTNAVQAIRDAGRQGKAGFQGRVGIRTRWIEPSEVEIVIRDNGIGIPDADAGKIFDPFFTTRDIGEGRGLGLSEAYGVVEKHRGRIRVDSAPGQGTTVTIRLPVCQDTDQRQSDQKQP